MFTEIDKKLHPSMLTSRPDFSSTFLRPIGLAVRKRTHNVTNSHVKKEKASVKN